MSVPPPVVRAPRGREMSCKGWPLRMLMNNLDSEVAERPGELIVHGGTGRGEQAFRRFSAWPPDRLRWHGRRTPLAATLNGACFLGVEVDPARIQKRLQTCYCDCIASNLDDALTIVNDARQRGEAVSVGLVGNCADVLPKLARRLCKGFMRRTLAVGWLPGR
jgi:urocanate hydratase